MARIKKRQLKEDRILSITARISVFLSKHWREIAGAIAAVFAIVGLAFLSYNYIARRNERVARSFAEAKALFDEAESASVDEEAQSAIEKYERAKAGFQEVLQKSGHGDTISRALFYSAKCSYQLGRYDEAISTFQKLLDKYPGNMLAHHVRKAIGQCYEQLGMGAKPPFTPGNAGESSPANDENLRKAIQQYDELLKYPETYITLEALVDKGRCYEKLGEWEQAIAAYKSITDKFQQNVELAVQARSKALAQKASNVIIKYESALGQDRSNPDFVKFLDEANAFERKKQWFEALEMYDKAIFSQKQYWAEKASGGYSRALQDASDALREYEDSSANAIRNIRLARKFEKQGDWNGALTYYRAAVNFDFLPGIDLFERAQFRIHWINSVEKSPQASGEGLSER